MKQRFTLPRAFSLGPHAAGVEIVSVSQWADSTAYLRYLVRYHCGHQGEIGHQALTRRAKEAPHGLCSSCKAKSRAAEAGRIEQGANAKRRKRAMFSAGTKAAGALVLGIATRGHRARDYRYRVRWLCCETEGEINHTSLAQRVQRGNEQCSTCANRASLARNSRNHRRKRPPEDAPIPAVRDARGYPWPLLTARGPLGPRWAGTAGHH